MDPSELAAVFEGPLADALAVASESKVDDPIDFLGKYLLSWVNARDDLDRRQEERKVASAAVGDAKRLAAEEAKVQQEREDVGRDERRGQRKHAVVHDPHVHRRLAAVLEGSAARRRQGRSRVAKQPVVCNGFVVLKLARIITRLVVPLLH